MSEDKCKHTDSSCNCSHEQIANEAAEKSKHDYNRRDFIKYGSMGLIGAKLSPAITYWLQGKGSAAEMAKNNAIRAGKAQQFTILHTADIHGQLNIHNEFFWENGKAVYKKRGGFATLKTMINELRKLNPDNTLVIDGGDCFQGSGIASLTEGQAMMPLINNIKYDMVLPGNWEVVYGKKMMVKDLNDYTAVKVCANMFNSDDDAHELMFPPYQVFTLGGVKVGFIGYNDPLTPIRQSPAYSKGITFTQPEVNLAKYVKVLREEKGCTMVFVVSHMGLAQQLHLTNQDYTQGVDYILGADTHERIRTPLQGKYSKVTEPGAFSSFISKLDIVIEDGKIKDESYELLDVDPDKYKPDEEMQHLVDKEMQPYEKELSRVVGQTKTPLVRYYIIETPMDNMITDAMMWKVKPDIAISNGFRFCPPLVPDEKTGVADITVDYMWSMLPVNSNIKSGEATGQQIMNWLEDELEKTFAQDATKRFGGWLTRFNGMKLTFTIGNEKGKRVQSAIIQGQPLDLEKTYTLAACQRDGDPDTVLCRITNIKESKTLPVLLHDMLTDYLAVHSPVSPVVEGRSVATDAPATLLTQVTPGVNYQFR